MDKLFAKIPFVDNILKGVGQIMLQENRWTGLLFLVGLFLEAGNAELLLFWQRQPVPLLP